MAPSLSRRSLLGALTAASLIPTAQAKPKAAPPAPPDQAALLAADEAFWRPIQSSFSLDRTVVNLNNGGCSPSPTVVHEAYKRYLDWSNQGPPLYMWQQLEPGIEAVRRELAREAGCDPECLAITRNASESLQTAQLGLDLKPGDEVLTTDQDYPRMISTWAQRVRRDGIVLKRVSFSVPATHAELLSLLTEAMTERTKVLHICHITNLTGQIFPVAALCAAARARGIVSIVDGAHAFAQFPFRIEDFGCDYYGTSLHKWLLAPVGTGFLYVRKERIAGHWPLQPAGLAQRENIRKFEEIGTHPAAAHDAVSEAMVFHRGIGAAVKAARLRLLRARWTNALRDVPGVRFFTSDDPALSCAIGTVGLQGMEAGKIVSALWDKARILATPITHAPVDPNDAAAVAGVPQFSGVRVTPNVYTTLDEIDLFAEVFRKIAEG